MGSQYPPKSETLSLIEMCRWELDRLRGMASEYRASNNKCREFLVAAEAALKEGPKGDAGQAAPSPLAATAQYQPAVAIGPDIQVCRDRAEEHRIFAERASDPRVKSLLREIAESYEKIGNRE
jgi:hypothetical protein